MFGSLLVIYATRKIIQMFSVFSNFTQFFLNLHQKELLGCFSDDIKMWPSPNVLNWHTSYWLQFNIYVDSMGRYANSLIFGVHYSSQNIRKKMLLKLRLWVCEVCVIMDHFTIIVSEIPWACVQEKNKMQLDVFGNEFWRCINEVRCVKTQHAARCTHKMQGILLVYTQHSCRYSGKSYNFPSYNPNTSI